MGQLINRVYCCKDLHVYRNSWHVCFNTMKLLIIVQVLCTIYYSCICTWRGISLMRQIIDFTCMLYFVWNVRVCMMGDECVSNVNILGSFIHDWWTTCIYAMVNRPHTSKYMLIMIKYRYTHTCISMYPSIYA